MDRNQSNEEFFYEFNLKGCKDGVDHHLTRAKESIDKVLKAPILNKSKKKELIKMSKIISEIIETPANKLKVPKSFRKSYIVPKP